MNNLLILLVTVLLFSCSSSEPAAQKRAGKVVQVEILNDESQRGSDFSDAYKQKSKNSQSGSEMWKALNSKGVWYRMEDSGKEIRDLLKKSADELGAMLAGADARQTTLIITALADKGYPAIPHLVKIFDDDRAAVFDRGKGLYWYEEKNVPPEKLELRVYAVLQVKGIAGLDAYGVMIFIHNQQTALGGVEIIYAAKGDYAVTKEDLVKNWQKWWKLNKKHYE